jgi:CRP-like cAMP-binding protein
MAAEMKVGLFEAEPDLAQSLSAEERSQAQRVRLEARLLDGEVDVAQLLHEANAFGALVYEGMLLHRLRLGEHETLRLMGPGDLLGVAGTGGSMLTAETVCTAIANTRVALLDDRLLMAAQRWPRLFSALSAKSAEQIERIALQLAICQLPRVADRVLAVMWLLAESWGRVTRSGVALPLALTHDTLGAMVGARRPTVTLAIGELTDRNALIRQGDRWLLLERPPILDRAAPPSEAPALLNERPTAWSAPKRADLDAALWTHRELTDWIGRLRTEHLENREQVAKRLAKARHTRERVAERRAELLAQRLSRSPAPETPAVPATPPAPKTPPAPSS